MSYRFEDPSRLASEIRRVAVERLDDALVQLEGHALAEDSALAVHTARKNIKKTRSLLRLVRGRLGRELARAQNDRLRAAAHELAATRERDAMSAAIGTLIGHSRAEMSPECAEALAAWEASPVPAEGSVPDVDAAAHRASLLIRKARDDARQWALGHEGWEIIEPGLVRLYRLGRAGLAEAERSQDSETVHEWRKRVKDLWYALRLIEPVWPAVIRPLSDEAHKLSEALGDHHDLGEIAIAAKAGAGALTEGLRDELLAVVDARQGALISEGLDVGRRLYAEPPKRFAQRLRALWEVWEGEFDRELGQDEQAGRPSS